MGVELNSFVQDKENADGETSQVVCVDIRPVFKRMVEAGSLDYDSILGMRESMQDTIDTMGTSLVTSMGITAVLVVYWSSKVGAGIGRDLREKIFKKVVSFSNAEMDKFSTASLITRSTNDIQQIQMVSIMLLRMIAYAPILAAGGILKVIRDADMILVMRDGDIVEQGNHETLLSKGGFYANLYNSQFEEVMA